MSEFYELLPSLIAYCQSKADCFEAGRLTDFAHAWFPVTSDPDIIGMVQGAFIEFDCPTSCLPALSCSQPGLSPSECDVIEVEIAKLLEKKVLSKCDHSHGEVISPVLRGDWTA